MSGMKILRPAGIVGVSALAAACLVGPNHVKPALPLTGANVMAAGVPHGPLVGRVMEEVEEWWIDQGFSPGRSDRRSRGQGERA